MYTFVESSIFARYRSDYLSDDEYAQLQWFLAENPLSGNVVPNSGGVRKLRWRTGQVGKQGGIRLIYYLQTHRGEIWLLTLYGKSAQENIPGYVLRQLKEAFEDDGI